MFLRSTFLHSGYVYAVREPTTHHRVSVLVALIQ